MSRLGMLGEWLEETVRAEEPAVRVSSCFPFWGDTLLVVPPRHIWPPLASSKVRWKGARFVPFSVVESLLAGRPLAEDGWAIDGPSECLLPASAPAGVFRAAVRSGAAVDRTGQGAAPYSTACLEFTPGSGLWFVAAFSSEIAGKRWRERLHAALRLLADSGFGGERSRGWGRAEMPEIVEGVLPDLLLKPGGHATETAYWMLSLFHPAENDAVDWERGNYSVTTRSGRVESDAGFGEMKKPTRMVTEGSVLISPSEPRGAAADVAPGHFPHPVYRAGFALSLPVPLRPAS